MMEIAEFFAGSPDALEIYEAVETAVRKIGDAEVRVSKSQIGFYREHPFAAVWQPKQYLRREAPPIVLSIFLKRRNRSSRWKEVIQPAEGRYTHHVELGGVDDVDKFVRARLAEAWEDAGRSIR